MPGRFITITPGPEWARVQRNLAALPLTRANRLYATAQLVMAAGIEQLRQEVPVGDRTNFPLSRGNLPPMKELFVGSIIPGEPTYVLVRNTAFYRNWVVHGRGDVYPIRAKFLHFWWHGEEIFTKHAGPSAANDYPARARQSLMGGITRALLQRHAEAIIREIRA